jgi:hypothetical protein
MTASSDAYAHLLETMAEVGRRFAGEEWMIADPADQAEALAVVLQHLATALETQFDEDPAHPTFRPIVTSWRKALGDNADARYHDARVDPAGTYRVRGNLAGAVYVSFTVEAAAGDGSFPTATVGVLNDTDLGADDNGAFEFIAGGPEQSSPWLPLPEGAGRITVRHYWEDADTPWRPPLADLGLTIDLIAGHDAVPSRSPAPTDESTAADIRRLATYVRTRTVELIPRPGEGAPPGFVAQVPHEFPPPIPPGAHALAAADAAYSMAPYLLGPDEALVMTVKWPACRCANVSLWTRQLRTFDYLRGAVSLNRAQAVREADGSVRIVVAHRDPGVPNWLSTEGRPFGLVFWRFMLPEGLIETPEAKVVPVDSLSS